MSKRTRGTAMLLAAGGSLPEPSPASHGVEACLPASPAKVSRIIQQPQAATSSPALSASPSQATVRYESPPKPAPSAKGLPEHLQRLQEVFEVMLSGRGLLKRRAEKVTHATLAPIVETVTKRAFKVEYIQQIKFLYPQAFDWQYVRIPSEQEKNRLDYHLLLQFERSIAAGQLGSTGSSGGSSSSTGRVNEAAERAELLTRAKAWLEAQMAQGAPPDTPVPCTPLPPRDSSSMIIGGSHMQATRRLSSGSPAHLRNSLAASHAAAAAAAAQQQQQQGQQQQQDHDKQQNPQQGQQQQQSQQHEQEQRAAAVGQTPLRASRYSSPAGGSTDTRASPRAVGVSPSVKHSQTQGEPQASPSGAGRTTPRVARRKLQLGDKEGDQQQQQQQGPRVQQQQQQQQHCEGDRHHHHQQQQREGSIGGVQASLSSDGQAVDMSAFDEPMSVQVDVQPVSSGAPASDGKGSTTQSPTQPPSASNKGSSLLSRLMSPESREAIRRNAARAQQSPALKSEADLLQSQRLLPQAMDLVRAAYGPKGSVVKQREELVELMRQKSSLSIALSTSEAARALQQLLQHAPEMVKQEQQGDVWVIRLNRRIDINAVRTRLCTIASQAARGSTTASPLK